MELVEGLNAAPKPNCEVFVGVPYVYLESVLGAIDPTFKVAAQNM